VKESNKQTVSYMKKETAVVTIKGISLDVESRNLADICKILSPLVVFRWYP